MIKALLLKIVKIDDNITGLVFMSSITVIVPIICNMLTVNP